MAIRSQESINRFNELSNQTMLECEHLYATYCKSEDQLLTEFKSAYDSVVVFQKRLKELHEKVDEYKRNYEIIIKSKLSEHKNAVKLFRAITRASQPNDISEAHDTKGYELAPRICLNVESVMSRRDLPDYRIFWIQDEKVFGFKINGVEFFGNIANISTTNKKRIPGRYSPSIPTLSNYEFIYWPYSGGTSKRKYRRIGSRQTLYDDILLNEKENVDDYITQAIHDLLVVIAIKQIRSA
jgi:hypothetical protein